MRTAQRCPWDPSGQLDASRLAGSNNVLVDLVGGLYRLDAALVLNSSASGRYTRTGSSAAFCLGPLTALHAGLLLAGGSFVAGPAFASTEFLLVCNYCTQIMFRDLILGACLAMARVGLRGPARTLMLRFPRQTTATKVEECNSTGSSNPRSACRSPLSPFSLALQPLTSAMQIVDCFFAHFSSYGVITTSSTGHELLISGCFFEEFHWQAGRSLQPGPQGPEPDCFCFVRGEPGYNDSSVTSAIAMHFGQPDSHILNTIVRCAKSVGQVAPPTTPNRVFQPVPTFPSPGPAPIVYRYLPTPGCHATPRHAIRQDGYCGQQRLQPHRVHAHLHLL